MLVFLSHTLAYFSAKQSPTACTKCICRANTAKEAAHHVLLCCVCCQYSCVPVSDCRIVITNMESTAKRRHWIFKSQLKFAGLITGKTSFIL